jgi:hypothetical protein
LKKFGTRIEKPYAQCVWIFLPFSCFLHQCRNVCSCNRTLPFKNKKNKNKNLKKEWRKKSTKYFFELYIVLNKDRIKISRQRHPSIFLFSLFFYSRLLVLNWIYYIIFGLVSAIATVHNIVSVERFF